jgi:hypothetical protein
MNSEDQEVVVSYFVLCDNVITEAGTGKQSVIGIYSGLLSQAFPMQANLAVAVGLRVQSPRKRNITFRFSGPDGSTLFDSPPLPANWDGVPGSILQNGFATVQISLNVRSMPFHASGVYSAAVLVDGSILAVYPLTVQLQQPQQQLQ